MRRPKRRVRQLIGDEREGFLLFMGGYCGMIPESTPDGAWEEMCKEGVRAFNRTSVRTTIHTTDG